MRKREYFDLGGLAQLTPKVVLPNNCTLELQFVAKNSPIKEPPETHNNQTIGETAEIAAASIVVEFINPAEITGGVVEQEQDQDTSKDATIWMTLDDQEQSLIQTKKIFKPKSGPSAIRYEDIPLPVFSQRVSNIIKNGKVQEETMPFIHEVGDHLLSLKTNPVKKDIEVFVLFLLNTFPELEKVSTGNADPQKKLVILFKS
ncbi:Hypothetical predicted protein [Cloeon dipterum]|uniref:Uncharacterized protein n=1 Tax=Cloeon dipterum TaxID=197152 RepID=A0A8S1CUT0_9INSE|nr:Hypothetical predicted protein [Cloeon dipterum]